MKNWNEDKGFASIGKLLGTYKKELNCFENKIGELKTIRILKNYKNIKQLKNKMPFCSHGLKYFSSYLLQAVASSLVEITPSSCDIILFK